MDLSTPQWEQSKENTAPLARGRNVQVLERRQSSIDEEEKERMLRHYERLVRRSEAPSAHRKATEEDDPLIDWLSYIKYHQEACPNDTYNQFLLMERCTRALVKWKRYHQDVRFIRVCVMYADKCAQAGEVFKYLHQHKIGTQVALFWSAWAWVAESKGEYAFAEKIFTKAINKNPHPISILLQRHKQFQRRMNRRLMNETQNLEDIDDDTEQQPSRRGRGAFGGLSEDRFRRNDRSQRGHQHHHQRLQPSRGKENAKASAGFAIYQDEDASYDNDGYNLDQSQLIHEERELERDSDRRKENTRQAERWNEHGGYSTLYADAKSRHVHRTPMAQQQPSFSIHVDDSCAEKYREDLEREQSRLEAGRSVRDERAFQVREREDMAEKLTRDPMRYIVNPSKLDSEQNQRHDETCTKSKGSKGNIQRGFDKRMISHDTDGNEKCFEESRALMKCYKLQDQSGDFNLIAQEQSKGESLMEMDSQSIEEVEMEEVNASPIVAAGASPFESTHVAMTHGDVSAIKTERDGTTPPRSESKTRRVLFSLNVSVDNQSRGFILNASTASSTVNEKDAVGVVGVGKEEETINTKFAMKELSMMFSSPAVGLGDQEHSTVRRVDDSHSQTAPDDGGGDTASYSLVAGLLEDDDQCVVDNSIIGQSDVTENDGPKNPIARSCSDPEFSEQALKTLEGGDDDRLAGIEPVQTGPAFEIFCEESEKPATLAPALAKKLPFQVYTEQLSADKLKDAQDDTFSKSAGEVDTAQALFRIYTEESNLTEPPVEATQTANRSTAKALSFAIFSDETSEPESESEPKKDGRRVSVDVFRERSDSSDGSSDESVIGDGNGETANLTLFGEAMEALKDMHRSTLNRDSSRLGNEQEVPPPRVEEPFEDTDDFTKFRSRDSGTVLDDTAAFGDISRIAIDEASRIHLSPGNAEFQVVSKDALDYHVIHKRDIRESSRELVQQARTLARERSFSREETDLALLLSTDSTVLDYPTQDFPKALHKKKAVEAVEVSVGSSRSLVKQELGRGTFGTVVLLEAQLEDVSPVAVKAQTPLDCLAWEFTVLKRLEGRLDKHGNHSYPFPKALSYVSLSNGGLLGMSAASFSGLNLVDIVNLYRAKENGPVPELIALHYTVRMLKHVELLHWHGKVLHCDIKPDNWVMTSSSDAFEGCSQEIISSDLTLVDFGRAIDMEAAATDAVGPMDVRFHGEAAAKDMSCVAMRKGWSWSFDIDTFGICASAHVLLYGTHLEMERNPSTKTWKPKKPLRRYWQREIWSRLFDSLLNVDEISHRAMGSRPGNLRWIRGKMEEYVKSRSKELESMLRHQARMLPNKK